MVKIHEDIGARMKWGMGYTGAVKIFIVHSDPEFEKLTITGSNEDNSGT